VAAERTSEAGRARLASPIAAASSPVIVRPVRNSSAVRAKPMMRGTVQCECASGSTPRRTCAKASFASFATSRMSHCMASVSPMPTAWPLIAAITGFRTFHAGKLTGSALNPSAPCLANVSTPADMSAPTQKAVPAPVSTTLRTSSRVSHARYAAASEMPIAPENALRCSGRSSVMTAMPSAIEIRRSWYAMVTAHIASTRRDATPSLTGRRAERTRSRDVDTLSYASAPVPVREDLLAAHTRAWHVLGRPGNWWTGAERIAIAAATRAALACALCRERKAALSPYTIAGLHDGPQEPSALAIDAVHRITTDPGRLTRRWFDDLRAAGLGD